MPPKAKSPTVAELKLVLGSAHSLWSDIFHVVEAVASPLDVQWRPSKSEFGRICLLQHKKRTLLYLTPETGKVKVGMVLGERAYGVALASSIPAGIKKMFSEAKPYAEGRGIRFTVSSPKDVSTIKKLMKIKTSPK